MILFYVKLQVNLQRMNYSIELEDRDFEEGCLKHKSYIRPNRIFTADKHIIIKKIGHLKKYKIEEAINKIIEIIKC